MFFFIHTIIEVFLKNIQKRYSTIVVIPKALLKPWEIYLFIFLTESGSPIITPIKKCYYSSLHEIFNSTLQQSAIKLML